MKIPFDKAEQQKATAEFQVILEANRAAPLSPPELTDHYLEHGEPEMAYEAFMLDLFFDGLILPAPVCAALLDIGIRLGVNDDPIFFDDSWERIERLCRRCLEAEQFA